MYNRIVKAPRESELKTVYTEFLEKEAIVTFSPYRENINSFDNVFASLLYQRLVRPYLLIHDYLDSDKPLFTGPELRVIAL